MERLSASSCAARFALPLVVALAPGAAVAGQAPGAQPASDRQVTYTEEREPCAEYDPQRLALFGDLHVHTSFSFDAAAISIGATPEDANRFARGEAIDFWPLEGGEPVGEIRIDRPLDFLAVTDHGEFLGERRLCREEGSPSYDSPFCRGTRVSERQGMVMLGQVATTENPRRLAEVCGEDGALCREYARAPWQRLAAAAEQAYDKSSKCSFTSFVGYEYTGTPGGSNYHRNVIFRNANVPELPVSYIDAPYDSLLWQKLDAACSAEQGCEYLTIPHNSNLANGRMAPYMRLERSLDSRRAYAAKRLEREPILEVFQHKGSSECINGLSSVLGAPDELCNVEAVREIGREETYATTAPAGGSGAAAAAHDGAASLPGLVSVNEVTGECGDEVGGGGMLGGGCVHPTDYLRSGLLVGLREEVEIGLNPVKLGVIASTDTHAATPGAAVESDWRGHVSVESTPAERLQPGLLTSGIDGNPGGLAGVWAVENSRDAIFEAMLRREVFGTSGPRIVPRFFAGWGYPDDLCASADLVATGYASGVPMGGDLGAAPAPRAKPTFVASALRDPTAVGAPLRELQLIKGWVDASGGLHNEVRTVARAEPEGGSADLCAVVRDESFDPAVPSYYYLRVVQVPTARWHVHDCDRLPAAERPAVCTDGSYPESVHEMAWTSPIWYRPVGEGGGSR